MTEEDYQRGVENGKNGSWLEDFAQSVIPIAGPPGYDEGYEFGKQQREESDD